MVWQLRAATADDLEPIMELEASIFVNDAWSAPMMLDELRSPRTHYLVAFRPESPELIEGYAGLSAAQGALEGDIQTIAVAPSARRRGLGRVLMQTLIAEARRRGARELFLEVRADNPHAQKLYESLGFEEIATRIGYYQPDGVDAVVMRLEIAEPRMSPAIGVAL